MRSFEIICPVYNEGEGILNFTEKLKSELSKLESRYDWKILFIHDPSLRNDTTWEVIKKMAQSDNRVSGISMWKRFGVQAALWAGLENTKGDFVIMMDGDGQHPPEIIHDLITQYESSHPVVLTKRKEGFRLKIFLFYKLMNLFSEHPPVLSHSDLRLLDRRVINILLEQFHERKPFLRTLMGYWGSPPVIEYTVQVRFAGKSSFNLKHSYNYFIEALLSAGHFPYRYLVPLALLIPAIMLTHSIVMQNWSGALIHLWFTFMTLIVGMIALNIERISVYSRKRPNYIIKDKINCL